MINIQVKNTSIEHLARSLAGIPALQSSRHFAMYPRASALQT
jgi:hypothetical protein